MNRPSPLRVFVIEDEGAIALLLEDMLSELGYEIAASAARLAKACDMARMGEFDFAILDVNLAGEPVFPVAAILQELRIPFIFSTGYGGGAIPAQFSKYPALSKPFSLEQLRQAILDALL
jgi:CheY-like chemotaxis protein